MKWEKVSNLEPAKLLEPLFTIIIAIIFSFFTVGLYERNLQVVIPALVAGLALVVLHIRKHHLDFNRYFVAAIIGSVFFALELVTTRLILDHYSPTTFYFIRCLIIFLITMLIFRPSLSKLGAKNSWLILLTAGFWVAYRIIVYYGYINLGVIFTTLMVMLAPVFVFTFARIFLKEKITWRNILSSVIIVGAVVYTIFA